tara:strand:+ start:13259 stop:13903 length:645 start_codon:yes stop_codon:yes gene_type:complete
MVCRYEVVVFLVLCSTLGGAAPSPAKPLPAVFTTAYGQVTLLADPVVADELNLPESTRALVRQQVANVQRLGPCSADCESQRAALSKLGGEIRKMLDSSLSDSQLERLQQISWQQLGPRRLFRDEKLMERLMVTAEQKKKLALLLKEYGDAVEQIINRRVEGKNQKPAPLGSDAKGAHKTLSSLREVYDQKAIDVLATEQRKILREALGKPFKF